ncbi:Uncharacterised protein [uncultured archaeon]|nr:Uncharacterised protein [uncultured archaeon]
MDNHSLRPIAGRCGAACSRASRRHRATGSYSGQVSMESLLMIGFLLLLLIPVLGYTLGMLANESWKLDAQQANVAVKRIASIANRLSMGGEGTFSTETVFIPSSVRSIWTSGNEITMVVDAKALGLIEQSAVADVPLALNPDSNWTNINGMNIILMNVSGGRVLLTK